MMSSAEPMYNEELCALAKSGDSKARDTLVENNLGFIRQTANSFYYKNEELCGAYFVDTDDLIQEGCIGLMKAINLFKPEQGNKFLTYAASAVRSAMWDLLRSHDEARSKQQLQNKDDLIPIRISLFDIVGDEEKAERIQLVADPLIMSPEEIYIEAETICELHKGMAEISQRESAYLRYRFGFDDDKEHAHTRTETAEHFKLSESRAKSTEELALDNLWLELPWWF